MTSVAPFPPGERLVDEANGLAVTVCGGRYTVWNEHPSGRWVENRVWNGPAGSEQDVVRSASRLLAQVLRERTGSPVTLPKWSTDEQYLRDAVPASSLWGPEAAQTLTEQMWEREAAARDADTTTARPKVYIAGPMRGIPEFNFPSFFAAENRLAGAGWDPFNPARYDVETLGFDYNLKTGREDLAELGFDLRHTLGKDMEYIAAEADSVAVLPGWEQSKGARAEVALALALGLQIIDAVTLEDLTGLVSIEAANVPAVPADLRDTPTSEDTPAPAPAAGGEVRTTSSTGGQKGVKMARFDLIPVGPLTQLAEHYGRGAAKYDAHQWRQGYEWSKSYAAAMRHLTAFWNGEDFDPELGSNHLVAVMWHMCCMLEFYDRFPEHDDRYAPDQP